jgi:crotonobetainyl-CoA:carnitine CoA-transferase CaiB-like acyl-CoA transferase
MEQAGPQSGPLSGLLVADFSRVLAGPYATMLLADLGADVIKVESPAGDDTRHWVPPVAGDGTSTYFMAINRNKRSIALDLKSAAGRRALLRLCERADVFVQNFRPGVAERLGVGEEAVRAVSPKIVYVSISGFGEKGPYAEKPAYDPVIQGFSGLASVQAGSDEARPRLLRTILPDKLTAITASQAITAALLARERTGEGQHVRLSMLEAVLAFLWASDMSNQTFVGDEPAREEPAPAFDLIYETGDGYMTVAALTDRQWAGLARVVGRPEWLEDERFKTPALRQKNIDARLQLTQEALMARPATDWLDSLTAAGVPCGPVLTRNQVIRHPQVAALGLVVETEHPRAGRLRQTRAAARFSRTSPEIRRGAPALGEHTQEILAELGYPAREIAEPSPEKIR